MTIAQMMLGAAGAFAFNQTIAANTSNYNLQAAAIAAGWDQITPLAATVTINSGVVVGSANTSSYAFDTGASFPAGSTLTLINNGYIVGAGGAGGNAYGNPAAPQGYVGGGGGPALRAQAAISITNNNIIGGGGGGGGGVGNRDVSAGGSGGAGSIVGAAGIITYASAHAYTNGNPGNLTTGGASAQAIFSWENATGGAGGNLGAGGGTGSCNVDTSSIAAGGAAGACTSGNASITWVVVGTRYGALN